MTDLQKLQLRRSEIRKRLLELGGLAEQTDESQKETGTLIDELKTIETREQALVAGGGTDEPKTETTERTEDRGDKELRELHQKANLGEVFEALLDKRTLDGATAELQQHYGLKHNQVPVNMLEQRAMQDESEDRQASAAPANVGRTSRPIIPAIFPNAAHSFLGIPTPMVDAGEAVYTVLTNQATVREPDKNAPAAHSQATFEAEVLVPKRLQASFFYSREDRARFAGMDSALRMNLSAALMDKLDQVILAGTDEGLLGGGLTVPGNPGAVSDWTAYKRAVTSAVDGTYADSPGSLRVVIGAPTYAHATGVFRGATTDNEDGYEVMERLSGGVRVSAHVPDVAAKRQDAVIGRATGMMHAVAPIWAGVTLIPDEVTLADNGQIKISAVMLYAFKVLRSAGFLRTRFQVAA